MAKSTTGANAFGKNDVGAVQSCPKKVDSPIIETADKEAATSSVADKPEQRLYPLVIDFVFKPEHCCLDLNMYAATKLEYEIKGAVTRKHQPYAGSLNYNYIHEPNVPPGSYQLQFTKPKLETISFADVKNGKLE
ncbi:MAG TPA: hypothetical protein VIM41_17375 [Gammaproteobacteria bacterium]